MSYSTHLITLSGNKSRQIGQSLNFVNLYLQIILPNSDCNLRRIELNNFHFDDGII